MYFLDESKRSSSAAIDVAVERLGTVEVVVNIVSMP